MNKNYLDFDEQSHVSDAREHSSHRSSHHNSPSSKKKAQDFIIKWFFILLGIGIIWYFYGTILDHILAFVHAYPVLDVPYRFFEYHISRTTVLGIIFGSFFSGIFFVALPSEALFLFYMNKHVMFVFFLILVVSAAVTMGLLVNYWMGRVFGERFLKWMFKENFEKYKRWINKYGGLILFFGNIFPSPIEPVPYF